MSKTNEVRAINANALRKKTPDEIKKLKAGLECCAPDECHGEHRECPYYPTILCVQTMAGDARAYIDELEERISLNTLRDAIYEDAVAHGLWESTDYTVQNFLDEQERACTPFDKTDEVLRSWAMEPIRKEVDELEMASESEEEYAEELADVIIMCLSVAGKLGIDIDAAMKRKMEINKGRPWKHGKEDA